MALSIFDDKNSPPTEDALRTALGKSYQSWCRLRDLIETQYAPIVVEWGYSGKSTGWGLRLKAAKRAVLYMTPCQGYFLASFALGEKAVTAAHAAGLASAILDIIDKAPKYAEGRGVRIEVRTLREIDNIAKLAVIKMAN
jgi:hypothetical protein